MFNTSFTKIFVNCSDIQIFTSTSITTKYIFIQLKVITKNTWQTIFMIHKFMNQQIFDICANLVLMKYCILHIGLWLDNYMAHFVRYSVIYYLMFQVYLNVLNQC